jgi:hypothetical protein
LGLKSKAVLDCGSNAFSIRVFLFIADIQSFFLLGHLK